jgi:hypothetical protein
MSVESKCAACGSAIVQDQFSQANRKKVETTVRNSLGVLRTDGLYAFYLFLKYKKDDGGEKILEKITALWREDEIGPLLDGRGSRTDQVIRLTENLQDVILTRQVTERALVYALYGLRSA